MSRQEMACGTCHAPLNVLGDPPAYIHPLSLATDGHQPEPVPAETLEIIARRCDFCGDPYPVWTLHGKQTISVVALGGHGGELAQDYGHAWAACAGCEHLAADRDIDGLAARAAAAMGWKHDHRALRHIAQLHAAFLHRAPQRRSLLTTTTWPPGNLNARELPKVRDRLVRLLKGGDQLPGPYTGQVRQQLADGLPAARLYWIDPEFTTLAGHAAAHLPDHRLNPDELPADNGLLIWAHPVTDRQAAAASWTVDHGTGSCQVVCYRHVGGGLDAPALQRVREQVGWLVPTSLVDLPHGQMLPPGGPAAPLLATWLLIAQQAAETLPAELDRATRRAYARQRRPAPEVRIVRIRARPGHRTDNTSGGGSGRGPLRQREWVGLSVREFGCSAPTGDSSPGVFGCPWRRAVSVSRPRQLSRRDHLRATGAVAGRRCDLDGAGGRRSAA
jgi:hypothetical protein